jgi:hypothetical protein
MGIIKYTNPKHIEQHDLESHVALCEQRRAVIEDQINRLEQRTKELYEQENSNRRLILGSMATIASAVLSTIVAVLIKFNMVL